MEVKNPSFVSEIFSSALSAHILELAMNLNIAEKLELGGKTIEELIDDPRIRPDRLHRFLLHLESNSLFSYDLETKLWKNSESSTYMIDSDVKIILKNVIEMSKMYGLFKGLLFSDQTGMDLLGKKNFFQEIMSDPEKSRKLQEFMKALTSINKNEIVEAIPIEKPTRMLDVGGGNGSLLISFALKYPLFTGALLELPHVAQIAKKIIDSQGLSERIQVVHGNFFESIPKGYDAVVLKHIVHDWTDEFCLKIFRNCRESLNAGDKLFIIECLLEKDNIFYKQQTCKDLSLLLLVNGKERRSEAYSEMLGQTGFEIVRIATIVNENVIEARAI